MFYGILYVFRYIYADKELAVVVPWTKGEGHLDGSVTKTLLAGWCGLLNVGDYLYRLVPNPFLNGPTSFRLCVGPQIGKQDHSFVQTFRHFSILKVGAEISGGQDSP